MNNNVYYTYSASKRDQGKNTPVATQPISVINGPWPCLSQSEMSVSINSSSNLLYSRSAQPVRIVLDASQPMSVNLAAQRLHQLLQSLSSFLTGQFL